MPVNHYMVKAENAVQSQHLKGSWSNSESLGSDVASLCADVSVRSLPIGHCEF